MLTAVGPRAQEVDSYDDRNFVLPGATICNPHHNGGAPETLDVVFKARAPHAAPRARRPASPPPRAPAAPRAGAPRDAARRRRCTTGWSRTIRR